MFSLPVQLSSSSIVHSGIVVFGVSPSALLTGKAEVVSPHEALCAAHFVNVGSGEGFCFSGDRLHHIADDSDVSLWTDASLASWVEVVKPLEAELLVLD